MPGSNLEQLNDQLELTAQTFGGITNHRILGCIINKIGAPLDEEGHTRIDLAAAAKAETPIDLKSIDNLAVFQNKNFHCFGKMT